MKDKFFKRDIKEHSASVICGAIIGSIIVGYGIGYIVRYIFL